MKQRLVGAAVLTALAVITIPLLFDAERPPAVDITGQMPPAPTREPVSVSAPQPVPLPADRPTPDPVPVGEMYGMADDAAAELAVPLQQGVTDNTVRAFLPADPPPADPMPAQAHTGASAPADVPPPPPALPDEPAAPPEPAAVAKPPQPTPPPPPAAAPKLDKSGLPQGWVVQVAAMTDRGKADALVAKLKLNGHPAFTTVTREASGQMIRIFVGPKADKAAIQSVQRAVERDTGLKTMVKPFKP